MFQLRSIAHPNTGALKRDRFIALKFLQCALHDLAHGADHRGNLLVRDLGAGVRRLLHDVAMLPDAPEEQSRHPCGDVAQRQVFHDVAERSLTR